MRYGAVLLILVSAGACSKDSPVSAPSQSVYAGSWSGLQPHSAALVGTGVLVTITGSTITSATVVTENYFGAAPPSGCQLTFTASAPTAIAGTSFTVPLSLASATIAGISSLPIASSATFSGTPTLQGTFTSATTMSGQLGYTISSATCAGTSYAGAVPTPGFGNQIRAFTASR